MKVEWIKFADRFEIDDFTRAQLKQTYPFFDSELLKMELWYIANPKRQKKNHYRFIVNWLNKVKKQTVVKANRDYKSEELEFRRKMEQAMKESVPPPPEWRALIDKLKPKGL